MTVPPDAIARVLSLAGTIRPAPLLPDGVERAPARYDGIDLQPTKAMARAAERGLALRRKFGRGGTAVGVARARDIKNRSNLSPSTVRRMVSYFARHNGDRKADGWADNDNPSAGWIAWLLWGGDPGRAWAIRKDAELDRADERAEGKGFGPDAWLQRRPAPPAWQSRAMVTRAAYWRDYIRTVHGPAERRLSRLWSRYLREQAGRIGERLEARIGRAVAGTVERQRLSPDDLEVVLDVQGEAAIARGLFASAMSRTVRSGFDHVAAQIGGLGWDPTLSPADQILGQMIVQVAQTTKDDVARLIGVGLENGATIGEIQSVLIQDFAFSPRRALRIARTESTAALNEGQEMAFRDAASNGVTLEIEWISARDQGVRPSHQALDGQKKDPGGLFTIPDGHPNAGDTARFPGDFNAAGEVVNCRCAARPIVK